MLLGQLISWFSMSAGTEHLRHIRRTLCSATILFQNKAQAVRPVLSHIFPNHHTPGHNNAVYMPLSQHTQKEYFPPFAQNSRRASVLSNINILFVMNEITRS
jgi:hypothetical protein